MLSAAEVNPVFCSKKIEKIFYLRLGHPACRIDKSRRSSGVERFLGKEEVTSSNLVVGSAFKHGFKNKETSGPVLQMADRLLNLLNETGLEALIQPSRLPEPTAKED